MGAAANLLTLAPTGTLADGGGSVTSVTASSTSAVALPTSASRIWISCDEAIAIIFGGSGVAAAVVATCAQLQPDVDYIFDLNPSQTHVRMIALTTTGNVRIARVS
jgi:hypothetical protein